jgi:aspartyl-tRNA(Asn)/glutamyl-tRNA(Gln) amidotransferase subunit A
MTLEFTLASARDALCARRISARELTEAHLAAITALEPDLHAFITVTPEQALAQADAADAAIRRGEGGPLTGLPVAIKDLFCTKGIKTTAASRILEPFIPPYESTVTANMLRDGAVFLGKTNLDEFAMGSSTTTSAFGPTINPWQRRGRIRSWCRAAPPAVRRQRSRLAWPWPRRAPIPADRSASRPPSAASSG